MNIKSVSFQDYVCGALHHKPSENKSLKVVHDERGAVWIQISTRGTTALIPLSLVREVYVEQEEAQQEQEKSRASEDGEATEEDISTPQRPVQVAKKSPRRRVAKEASKDS